ncbi:MAG TPA: GNAT family N-acetyltransferase [Tepidisphaeraceae bacterium]|nr:GNAT family N-acetyltransferase [Tepidisphaeraceae bacterium]
MTGTRVGYLIGCDQYFKHDDVGIIYQINVAKEYRRSFVAAALLKAQFERSAYGCKLYCCWCAQDIEANRFWESMGFVPLAFRAGSEKKARVHIFWQKRIRQGDATTPWWFPSKTNGGSIREDRVVLPIPPGTHWSDAKPMVYPEANEPRALATGQVNRKKCVADASGSSRSKRANVMEPPVPVKRNGLMFDIPKQGEPLPEHQPTKAAKPKATKVKRVCDPQLATAARELRDRWLEQVNSGQYEPAVGGKYDVTRAIEGRGEMVEPSKMLAA